MKIELATSGDLIDIFYLFKECARDMNQRGFFHWNQYHPSIDILKHKTEKKSLFITKHLGICIGCIALDEEPISEYAHVKWSGNGSKNLIIHWLAIHPLWQNQDIAKRLIEFAEEYARKEGYGSIRLDIYASNDLDVSLCNARGYSEAGEIYRPFQKTPFKCFEKIVR